MTKPHDDAYDKFIKYVSSNYEKIFKENNINYKEIYNENFIIEKRNLFKYFAKHAGCKIVTGTIAYNVKDLKDFILSDKDSENFMLHFQIKEGIKTIMETISGYYHLYNGPTSYIQLTEDYGFCGWQSYHWFTTNWFYSSELNKENQIDSNPNQVVEVKMQTKCIEKEKDLNIHLIEYCGVETVEKTRTKFLEMTEKVYH